jgi:hypothetical protein
LARAEQGDDGKLLQSQLQLAELVLAFNHSGILWRKIGMVIRNFKVSARQKHVQHRL